MGAWVSAEGKRQARVSSGKTKHRDHITAAVKARGHTLREKRVGGVVRGTMELCIEQLEQGEAAPRTLGSHQAASFDLLASQPRAPRGAGLGALLGSRVRLT